MLALKHIGEHVLAAQKVEFTDCSRFSQIYLADDHVLPAKGFVLRRASGIVPSLITFAFGRA